MARAPLTAGPNCGEQDRTSEYEIDWEHALQLIKERGAFRVGLQAPEGLKRSLPAFASKIEDETGAMTLISGDPCFGACDIDTHLCQVVDLMIHLGHAELGVNAEQTEEGSAKGADGVGKAAFEKPDNVLFLEAAMPADLTAVVAKAAGILRSSKVGVSTTIQHVHKIDQAISVLKDLGIQGLIGQPAGRTKYPGQVLGCSYAAARSLEVEEHLFIGTGQFHPLGIALATGKRVVTADPVTGDVGEIDADPLLRRRFAAISRAGYARRLAILVSKKPGQKRMKLAEQLKARGEAAGKEMFMVYLDNIEPDRLLNLGAEAAVCTACPRVALDDAAKYRISILTPPEFEILVGDRKWENYKFDEIEF